VSVGSLESEHRRTQAVRELLTMSGQSSSLTVLTSHEIAARFRETYESEAWRNLPDCKDKDSVLFASSRNNHMEYDLRRLMLEFPCGGLAYLRKWDEIINRPAWVVALQDARLTDAIVGIHRFFSLLREQPARCASCLHYGPSESDVAEALRMPVPSSFAEARDRYDEYRRRSDGGDDIWSLVSFLHAHVLLLESARARDLSALYALWAY
jgi:hypothetical protein